jgi:tol-pal system protein YbgF
MNHNFKSFLKIPLSFFVFSGCVSSQIEALRNELKSEVSELRGIQAEHTASISEVKSELRTITGKVEEVQYVSQGKTQQLEQTIKQLGSRVPPPQGVPVDLLNEDEERISPMSGEPASLYKDALIKLRSGDFVGASDGFKSFAEGSPDTTFTDNALFWLGICYSKLGQNDRAIVSFSDVFQTFPAEDMVAPALFYLAESFQKMGSANDAKLTLQKLVDEFPRSEYAVLARAKLPKPSSGSGVKSGSSAKAKR